MTDREPVDVADRIRDWLKADLAARFPELEVVLEHDSEWALGSGPELVIADDGDPLGMWPAATTPTIRGTSWTSGRNTRYANAAMTRLLTARIPGLVILPGTGVLEARDSKTDGDLASFTVRPRARLAVPQ
ncbi:hypothetical protein [Mycolicibacterium sp. F2034L]|uniref:hypothetical protein n=1 Tax=Mycolicibacterium sp. F2034L TaxID=2926422 RepID=UPI001FF4A8AD|nr:hypothetical protein [Mycolicibacterium sp. F2034L]MCK0174803.1 hypothetical protein [Mycolicibacterium sp. F2034L]